MCKMGPTFFVSKRNCPNIGHNHVSQTMLIGRKSKGQIGQGLVLKIHRSRCIKSMIGHFDVTKGKEDIQIGYDASKYKLNATVWSPNFGLPMVDLVGQMIDPESWVGDIDIGEMFLNLTLDIKI
eukprot:9007934-Ditylum_brightwellii.AAC.1